MGSIRLENVDPKLHKAFRKLCLDQNTNMQVKLKLMLEGEVRKAQQAKARSVPRQKVRGEGFGPRLTHGPCQDKR